MTSLPKSEVIIKPDESGPQQTNRLISGAFGEDGAAAAAALDARDRAARNQRVIEAENRLAAVRADRPRAEGERELPAWFVRRVRRYVAAVVDAKLAAFTEEVRAMLAQALGREGRR